MESKEALETLFDLLCEREHTNSEHSFWLKLYQDVKEDLEALEFIKTHYKMNGFNELIPLYLDYGDEEKFVKLERWLEK